MNRRKCDSIVGVIGDHCLDKDYCGTYSNVMSREQKDMRVFESILPACHYSGGGAANIVDLLQGWGVRVLPCGVWNPLQDHNSRILYNLWRAGFVNDKHMVSGYGTPAYVKYYESDGEHIFRANETLKTPGMNVQREIVRHIGCLAQEVDVLIVADYDEAGEGILTPFVMDAIRSQIRCTIIGMSRKRIRRFSSYNYLILADDELEAETDSDADIDMMSRAFDLMYMTKAEKIIVTLRGKGAVMYGLGSENGINMLSSTAGHVEIEETLVTSQELSGARINTCGCGDTFTAAFAICLAAGMAEVEAMKRGNAAARVQCRNMYGSALVDSEAWEQEYSLLYGERKGERVGDVE